MTRRKAAIAAANEPNMGEGQVPMKVSHHIYVFSTATNDIHRFGRAAASVGIAGRKEEYVD